MIRQFIRVRRSDGGNPVNLTGSIRFDDGFMVDGVATAAGVLTFEFDEARRLTGVWCITTCDGAAMATGKRGATNDKDGQSLLWDEDVIITTGVNPFDVPLDDLLDFRGSIWTARAPIPFGPRPGQPDNILGMDYWEAFNPADQRTMLEAYVGARKYRHAPQGPFIDPGYHGQYPGVDFRTDPGYYAQGMQRLWNGGVYPVLFMSPDGWSQEQCETLTPIFQRPDFQRVVRLAVPFGWEPGGYNISNAQWCERIAWARRCFPNAILGIHMIADFDAPVGGDDERLVPPGMDTKQWAWTNVYNAGARFFLRQVGGYLNGPNEIPTADFLAAFATDLNWFVTHFRDYGLVDFKVVAGEYAAYVNYWQNYAERYSVEIGDEMMARVPGLSGFFDGGTPRR